MGEEVRSNAGEWDGGRYLCNGRDSKLVVEAGLAEEEVCVRRGVIIAGEDIVGRVDVASYQSVHVDLGWVVMVACIATVPISTPPAGGGKQPA